MWKRSDLKRSARQSLRANYLKAAAVCLLLAVLAASYGARFILHKPDQIAGRPTGFAPGASNTEIVNETLQYLGFNNLLLDAEAPLAQRATAGVLANLFNNVTGSGSFLFGVLNAINQMAFSDRLGPGIILLAGAALGFLYWVFVGNLLRVGSRRFFMETRRYTKTQARSILYVYHSGYARHVAAVMLRRALRILLWSLTIVGGVIATYNYRLVPYILAENPETDYHTAMRLSKSMMAGNRWRAFLLDVSFLPWGLLSLVTLGLSGLLFSAPYTAATGAELYMQLRGQAIAAQLPDAACLNDSALVPGPIALDSAYPHPAATAGLRHHLLSFEYDRRYTALNLILIFFCYCFIGWVWEVSLHLLQDGSFVNRGTMVGPWLPIYGFGGIVTLLVLRPVRKKPVFTFVFAMLVCGTMEYFTGLFLEKTRGVRYWDYDGYLLNIDGRVCLEGLLVFAVAASLGIYFIAPALDDLLNRVPRRVRTGLAAVLLCLFLTDAVYSALHPHTGDQITYPLRGQTTVATTAGTASSGASSSGAAAPAATRTALLL